VEQHEKDHPYWRIEVLVSLIKWGLKSLKHYIEDVHDHVITWESPLVELHYPIDWNWKERGSSDIAPGGHIFGKFTPQNTATKQLALKTLSSAMACQFNALALADATNWAWYEKLKNYYTPVLPVQLCAELFAIKNKCERRERFDELVRPFSIGATRINCDEVEFKSGKRIPKRITKRLADIPEIRINGDVNGRRFDIGLIFEINPLIADYDQKKAYHPIVVGLVVLRRSAGEPVPQDLSSNWPKSDREELWDGLLQAVEKITGLLVPKTESRESVIVSVNSMMKIPAEHWRPENRSAVINKMTDAFAQFGEINQFSVESGQSINGAHRQNVCPVCDWIHDAGFTQIKTNLGQVITLGGVLPDIVNLVHRAHATGMARVNTKDPELIRTCGGYKHPCKAFDNLKHRDDYKALFDTRKRGFISLRGALGIIRNKSESNLE
jgi:hypothetical protein